MYASKNQISLKDLQNAPEMFGYFGDETSYFYQCLQTANQNPEKHTRDRVFDFCNSVTEYRDNSYTHL